MNYNPHEILKPIYSSISILHPSFKSLKEHYRYDKVNLIYLLVTYPGPAQPNSVCLGASFIKLRKGETCHILWSETHPKQAAGRTKQ